MSTLFYEHTPFDILFRNFFQDGSQYNPVVDTKLSHPVDIYTSDSGLTFEIACTGIPKSDIELLTQDNTLRVNYTKSKENDQLDYIHRGIAKRSFNLGWKIDGKFDLSKANANFADGLLTIDVPFSKGSELKKLQIK